MRRNVPFNRIPFALAFNDWFDLHDAHMLAIRDFLYDPANERWGEVLSISDGYYLVRWTSEHLGHHQSTWHTAEALVAIGVYYAKA